MVESRSIRGIFRTGLRWLSLVGVVLTLAGCISRDQPKFADDPAYQDLMAQFRDSAVENASRRQAEELAAVRLLRVVESSDGTGYVVSADLAGASVADVVNRILKAVKQPYDLSNAHLGGRATVRFNRLPLVQALNLILASRSLSVAEVKGMLVFRNGSAIEAASDASDGESGDNPIAESVALKNISSDEAVKLLEGLYPIGSDQPNSSVISYGALSDLNEVFVSGARKDVLGAVAVLNRADRAVPHVLIEALVVEFDTTATAALGADIANAASGVFSDASSSPGADSANLAFTFTKGATNVAQLMATIDFMVNHAKAQVLSRPYLSVRSGQAANVKIVNDQYLAVGSNSDGVNITSQTDIVAGVQLDITPTVQADNVIRLDMTVEDSSFEPVNSNALAQREVKSAKTSVNVPDGQAVVIGGLNQRYITNTNSGIPWLRGVPVLNLLTAKQSGEDRSKEVVVYLIPRIWDPNTSPPMTPFPELHPTGDPETRFERLHPH